MYGSLSTTYDTISRIFLENCKIVQYDSKDL